MGFADLFSVPKLRGYSSKNGWYQALRPLPEKWHGLTDNEQIYRQRYLDLIVNEESRERFQARSRIIREIREFFWSRDFLEAKLRCSNRLVVRLPVHSVHFNALDCDFSLRIALELHLKDFWSGVSIGFLRSGGSFGMKGSPAGTILSLRCLKPSGIPITGMMELTRSLIQQVAERALGTLQMERRRGCH